jgi:hypothetical protein
MKKESLSGKIKKISFTNVIITFTSLNRLIYYETKKNLCFKLQKNCICKYIFTATVNGTSVNPGIRTELPLSC